MKKIIFLITLTAIILLFGRSLNPFSNTMFTSHDETQAARIQQFFLELKSFHIPPRMAADFSFKMGYPVFNFYAPASYWISSVFVLSGFDAVSALKLSFLFSILVGFIAAYLLLKEYFDFFPSLTGAVLYVSSLYYSLDIFVRGNLAEVWFLALFPLAFFLIERNSKKSARFSFFFLTILLLLLFTVHNLLSAAAVFVILVFILIKPNKKTGVLAMILGLLLSSYFLLPMIAESHLTYASYVVKLTKYWDHFVCPSQLWQSTWGFGGSTKGCVDGMSFKIGKIQLILGGLGLLGVSGLLGKQKKPIQSPTSIFYFLLAALTLFISTYLSKPIWDAFSPILSLFQFPWRFIGFSLIGLAFLGVYFLEKLQFKFKNIFLFFLICFVIINYSKYFSGQTISKDRFEKTYLSQDYIENKVAYKIAEYLPRTANYNVWRKYEKTPPKKSEINIHYFPFWTISVDGKPYRPTEFDELGRPVINLGKKSTIQILYKETPIEKLGNFITLVTFGILLYSMKSKKLWNKQKD